MPEGPFQIISKLCTNYLGPQSNIGKFKFCSQIRNGYCHRLIIHFITYRNSVSKYYDGSFYLTCLLTFRHTIQIKKKKHFIVSKTTQSTTEVIPWNVNSRNNFFCTSKGKNKLCKVSPYKQTQTLTPNKEKERRILIHRKIYFYTLSSCNQS